jgi:hypothetical protein
MRVSADEKRNAVRFDLSDPSTYYIGYADYVGLEPNRTTPDEGSPSWTIKKISFVSGNPVSTEWTMSGAASWTDRATETYE